MATFPRKDTRPSRPSPLRNVSSQNTPGDATPNPSTRNIPSIRGRRRRRGRGGGHASSADGHRARTGSLGTGASRGLANSKHQERKEPATGASDLDLRPKRTLSNPDRPKSTTPDLETADRRGQLDASSLSIAEQNAIEALQSLRAGPLVDSHLPVDESSPLRQEDTPQEPQTALASETRRKSDLVH